MPILTFVRHCESEDNKVNVFSGRIDSDVTADGLEKAKTCGLVKETFDLYYCSSQKRTRKTLMAMFPQAIPIEDDRLLTRYLGDWEGKIKSVIDPDLIALYQKGLYTPPGAETADEIDRRVCSFIKEVFDNHPSAQKILVVTSNGVIRSVKRIFFHDRVNTCTENLGYIVLTEKEYTEWRKANDRRL